MLKFCPVVFFLLSPLFTGLCMAAHPLITDDAGTMGKAKTQIEVNGQYERQKDHGIRERTFTLGSTVSYGLTETSDMVLTVPYLFTRTKESHNTHRERGFGDVTAELKWRWYEGSGLSLAIKPGMIFPTGNDRRGLGAGKVGYQLFVIATKEAKPFTFHANAGYIGNKNTGGEREDLWHASLAGELPLGENLTIVANGGIERDPERSFHRERIFVLGGLIWRLSESFAIDGGLKYSSTKTGSHGWSLLTGVTFMF